MGVSSGCGCKEVYRLPHTTYPPYSVLFTAASLLKKIFFFLMFHLPVLFVITFYVFKKFSRSINTHTGNYGHWRPGVHIM